MTSLEGLALGVNIGLFIGITVGAFFLARIDAKVDILRNELHWLAKQMGHRISIPSPPAGMDPPPPPTRPDRTKVLGQPMVD